VDIRARPDDPEVDLLARQIFAMFPKCMKCGQPIGAFEDADIRILSHRVVHRTRCSSGSIEAPAAE
jgi:hypothetical protein